MGSEKQQTDKRKHMVSFMVVRVGGCMARANNSALLLEVRSVRVDVDDLSVRKM